MTFKLEAKQLTVSFRSTSLMPLKEDGTPMPGFKYLATAVATRPAATDASAKSGNESNEKSQGYNGDADLRGPRKARRSPVYYTDADYPPRQVGTSRRSRNRKRERSERSNSTYYDQRPIDDHCSGNSAPTHFGLNTDWSGIEDVAPPDAKFRFLTEFGYASAYLKAAANGTGNHKVIGECSPRSIHSFVGNCECCGLPKLRMCAFEKQSTAGYPEDGFCWNNDCPESVLVLKKTRLVDTSAPEVDPSISMSIGQSRANISLSSCSAGYATGSSSSSVEESRSGSQASESTAQIHVARTSSANGADSKTYAPQMPADQSGVAVITPLVGPSIAPSNFMESMKTGQDGAHMVKSVTPLSGSQPLQPPFAASLPGNTSMPLPSATLTSRCISPNNAFDQFSSHKESQDALSIMSMNQSRSVATGDTKVNDEE